MHAMMTARRSKDGPQTVGRLLTFNAVVGDFIAHWRKPAQCEHNWFATQPSLKAAITTAGMAVSCAGKRCLMRGVFLSTC